MARFKDDNLILNAFTPHLQPGEKVQYFAYGVKQPHPALVILLVFLAILPGLIAVALLTKEYMIGLTDRGRLIVLRFSGKMNVKEISDYNIGTVGAVKTSTGSIFTHIRINDPQKPFVAKFHRLGLKTNREHAMAIAQALETKQLPGSVAA